VRAVNFDVIFKQGFLYIRADQTETLGSHDINYRLENLENFAIERAAYHKGLKQSGYQESLKYTLIDCATPSATYSVNEKGKESVHLFEVERSNKPIHLKEHGKINKHLNYTSVFTLHPSSDYIIGFFACLSIYFNTYYNNSISFKEYEVFDNELGYSNYQEVIEHIEKLTQSYEFKRKNSAFTFLEVLNNENNIHRKPVLIVQGDEEKKTTSYEHIQNCLKSLQFNGDFIRTDVLEYMVLEAAECLIDLQNMPLKAKYYSGRTDCFIFVDDFDRSSLHFGFKDGVQVNEEMKFKLTESIQKIGRRFSESVYDSEHQFYNLDNTLSAYILLDSDIEKAIKTSSLAIAAGDLSSYGYDELLTLQEKIELYKIADLDIFLIVDELNAKISRHITKNFKDSLSQNESSNDVIRSSINSGYSFFVDKPTPENKKAAVLSVSDAPQKHKFVLGQGYHPKHSAEEIQRLHELQTQPNKKADAFLGAINQLQFTEMHGEHGEEISYSFAPVNK
jgi:hypothetical protein